MVDDAAVECPQCGHRNEAASETCANCHVDLEWALERGGEYWTEAEATRPPLILISTDHIRVLTLVGILLERAGYRVARAEELSVTVNLAERLDPDLMVTHGRSTEMIPHLRANPALQDVPVVVLGPVDYETASAAIDAGAMCFVPLPLPSQPLVAVTEAVLAGKAPPPLVLFVHALPIGILWDLGRKGYRTWPPPPGPEDITSWAKLLKPDAIAICVYPPDRPGMDVLAKLKADEKVRDIPVVMVDQKGLEPPFRQRALELGAHAVYSGDDRERLQEVFRAAMEEG